VSGYEVLALVLGSLIAREIMAAGLKAIANSREDKVMALRMEEAEKQIEELRKDIKDIKRMVVKIAVRLNVDSDELNDFI